MKKDTLQGRILFTLMILLFYRIGSFIPVPCVELSKLSAFTESVTKGVFSVFNSFSGGSVGRLSVFALGIMPYITSSIIMQLVFATTPELKKMKKEGGEKMQEKINQYTKALAILIGFVQGFSLASFLISYGINGIDANQFRFLCSATMVCGTFILIWFGNLITAKGIGNGTSLVIFTGIVAEAPKDIFRILNMAKNGNINAIELFIIFAVFAACVFLVVMFEKSHRLLYIQYPRQVQQYMQQSKIQAPNFMPLKINPAGVIPPIFASSVLLLPMTVSSAFKDSTSPFVAFIMQNFSHGKPFFILCQIALIVFFSFFYNNVVFDAEEMAEQLKKNNVFVPGTRPGEQTSDLLKSIMSRLSLIGAVYLSVICAIPELLSPKYGYSFFIGGTGLLIVVNVVTDTIAAVQTYNIPQKYEKVSRRIYR